MIEESRSEITSCEGASDGRAIPLLLSSRSPLSGGSTSFNEPFQVPMEEIEEGKQRKLGLEVINRWSRGVWTASFRGLSCML